MSRRSEHRESRSCSVYRQVRPGRRHVAELDGARFILLDTPLSVVRAWRPLARRFDPRELLRIAAKLVGRSRVMYCVVERGSVVHHGWITIGESPLYDVGSTDAVIGPIATSPEHRGRGLAGYALHNAMNAMAGRGHDVFFIHTYEDHVASRRAIEKAGFGRPIATVARGPAPNG